MGSQDDLAAAVERVSAELTPLSREADELAASHETRPSSTDLVVSGGAAAEQASRQLQRLYDEVAAKHHSTAVKADELKGLKEAQMRHAPELMVPLLGGSEAPARLLSNVSVRFGACSCSSTRM